MTAKDYLEQYMALNAEIEQIEHELGELASQPTHLATDCVLGSPDEEPYQNIPIPIRGQIQSKKVQEARKKLVHRYDSELEKLYQQRDKAEEIISGMDNAKARTIIRYHYVDGMEWPDVAAKMGSGYTVDGVKKYAYRYLQRIF